MIDFAKITKTLDGYDCHYFGVRESYGSTLYCFGVFHPGMGVHELAYDAAGKRLRFENGSWVESTATNYQIIAPPKIVEVTRWLGYDRDDSCLDGYYCFVNVSKPVDGKFDHVEKVTARFEVLND